jgi:hypothetical protein
VNHAVEAERRQKMKRPSAVLLIVAMGLALSAAPAAAGGSVHLSPHHANFGDVEVGSFGYVSVTLTNGTSTLQHIIPQWAGPSGDFYFLTDDGCTALNNLNLNAGVSCQLLVAFQPATTGKQSATLTVLWGTTTLRSISAHLVGNGV